MTTPDTYSIPAAVAISEETIKKSRFISLISHTDGREAARQFIQTVREQHPEARHHCWAFIAGAPNDAQKWGFSDDGEPSGTAGKPILARIQGSGLGELCCVVVRYSGGIKLGTGGLVRAYGGGAAAALSNLVTTVHTPQTLLTLRCQYHQQADIQHVLNSYEGHIVGTEYGGTLTLTLSLPSYSLALFKARLNSHLKGQIDIPE